MTEKVCTSCKEPKPIDDFALLDKGVRKSQCKECVRVVKANYRDRKKAVKGTYLNHAIFHFGEVAG